jgi:hypothetical protein
VYCSAFKFDTSVIQQVPQHTGVPPIIMQQVQPAFMQADMQSQQPWIMSQQPLSPLVQVTQQPSLVISHLHIPIIMLQQHTIIPFIMQQQLTIPPAIMVQRFCIMAQAAGSEHEHVIFIPPAHFSILNMQRGTITMLGAIGVAEPVIPEPPIPGIPIVGRSIIIVPVMIIAPKVGILGVNTNEKMLCSGDFQPPQC